LSATNDPGKAELACAWNGFLGVIERYAVSLKRPVLITETGFMSRDGTSMNPGDWSIPSVIDENEQALCYDALLSQIGAFPSVHGILFWAWELGSDGGSVAAGYTPYGKKAETILREYWR
jgi:hypothetical protein